MSSFDFIFYVVGSLLLVLLMVGLAIYSWRQRGTLGVSSFSAFLLTNVGYLLSNLMLLENSLYPGFFYAVRQTFIILTGITLMIFVFQYTNKSEWLKPWWQLVWWSLPVLSLALVWTNDFHHWIWTEFTVVPYGSFVGVRPVNGGLEWLVRFTTGGFSTAAAVWIVYSISRSFALYRRQAIALLIGVLAPGVINILITLGVLRALPVAITPLNLAITAIAFGWALFRFRLFDLKPIAHETLIENTSDGMIVLDLQDRVVELNKAAQALLGVVQEYVLGKTLEHLVPEIEMARQRALQVPNRNVDFTLMRNQTPRYFDLRVSFLTQHPNKMIGSLVVLRDITARQQAENALRESEAQLRALINYSPAAIIKFSPEGKILLWNDAAEKIYGWTAGEVLGKLLPTVPSEKLSEKIAFQNQVNQGQVIPYTEVQRQRKDGSSIHVGLSVAPLKNEVGQVYAQMSISTDISELKYAQAELTRREQTVALLEERARLGRDLHDSVTQLLYSVMLFADASKDAAQNAKLDLAQQYLSRLSETSQQALKELRLRVFELRPSVLVHEGLASALHQRLAQVEQRAGVQTDLNIVLPHSLPAPVELAIYWIAQEALNNALKHANATRISLHLSADENSLKLEIADDGKGFDLDLLQEHAGLGMSSMYERVHDLGGTFDITSKPDHGTRIQVTLPGYILISVPAEPLIKENRSHD